MFHKLFLLLLLSQGGWAAHSTPRFAECQGRLTVVSAAPVPAHDQMKMGTLYFTPYNGNHLWLFDGEGWRQHSFPQISLRANHLLSNKNHDVFIFEKNGNFELEFEPWANDTARAHSLTTQDGVLVKDGNVMHRYLGTIRTDDSGLLEDSRRSRFIWNYYNRVTRNLYTYDTTDSWTYSSPHWTAANSTSENRVQYVVGFHLPITAKAVLRARPLQSKAQVGIGLDSTSQEQGCYGVKTSTVDQHLEMLNLRTEITCNQGPSLGYHYLQLLQKGDGNPTVFFGDYGNLSPLSFLEASIEG